jgi:hypothetical protein
VPHGYGPGYYLEADVASDAALPSQMPVVAVVVAAVLLAGLRALRGRGAVMV